MEFILQYIANVWQLERLKKRYRTDRNLPYFDRVKLRTQINSLSETNAKTRKFLKSSGVLLNDN